MLFRSDVSSEREEKDPAHPAAALTSTLDPSIALPALPTNDGFSQQNDTFSTVLNTEADILLQDNLSLQDLRTYHAVMQCEYGIVRAPDHRSVSTSSPAVGRAIHTATFAEQFKARVCPVSTLLHQLIPDVVRLRVEAFSVGG